MSNLSIEELIKYAEEKVANLTKVIDQSALTNIKDRLIEERQLAQVGLDALREVLKGDQVPVAYIADCGTIISDGDPFFDDYKNPKPLFTAPQKPVVLLPKFTDRHTCMNAGCDAAAAYKEDVIAMNKAAGGIVKDGE